MHASVYQMVNLSHLEGNGPLSLLQQPSFVAFQPCTSTKSPHLPTPFPIKISFRTLNVQTAACSSGCHLRMHDCLHRLIAYSTPDWFLDKHQNVHVHTIKDTCVNSDIFLWIYMILENQQDFFTQEPICGSVQY